jgi:NADH dehydrogenase
MNRCDVLVVGAGFGGAFAARELERRLRKGHGRVLLVAPDNFLLFSPLLPEAASGTIEPRHAVIPLRELLDHTELLIGKVEHLDLGARTAIARDMNGDPHEIEFRLVILAAGSIPATLPIPGLLEHAVGFKTLADAIWLRNRVLHQLDAADAATEPTDRRRLLTFTFIGGGYAGVEAVAELESLARDAAKRYRNIAPVDFRWVLVEAADSLLPGLNPDLARFTLKVLRRRGIEVHLDTTLESCLEGRVVLSDADVEPYDSGTIVWTAGQRPSPIAADWGLPHDPRGSIPVDDRMQVEGHTGVFAIGDVAAVPDPEGGIAPNTAQHAVREAATAARNAAAQLGIGTPAPFAYRNRGLAVTLGKWQGTAQVRRFTFTGPLAWWMGRSYHLWMMPGLGRKLRVVSDWTMSLLFKRDVSQLGQLGAPTPLEE